MLDPVFVRPIAHRGLHDVSRGIIENTAPAFAAAIAGGHGIECDLQPIGGGEPVVHHDEALGRLIEGTVPLNSLDASALARLRYRGSDQKLLRFTEFLELVGGRVPLLVEIKSDWRRPANGFLETIAIESRAYKGPIALMSFDPAVITRVRELAPSIPRGIVSGVYQGEGWWSEAIGPERRQPLSDLLESGPCRPDFYAYHVNDLPTAVTRYVREVAGLPLFTWTVRKPEQWGAASRWADAPIFEGAIPPGSRFAQR